MPNLISNDAVYAEATHFLSHIDADWVQLINAVGVCTLAAEIEPSLTPYQALVQAVCYQQLHGKAGDAIFARFKQHFSGFATPEQLVDAKFDDLRACSFSGRKIETIQGIAAAAIIGAIPSRVAAEKLSNKMLIERLITLKGIGRWTVEMMLIFNFGRMDILPVDDFAVAAGYTRLKKQQTKPKTKEMVEIGKAWSPYRSVASWYLWRVPKVSVVLKSI